MQHPKFSVVQRWENFVFKVRLFNYKAFRQQIIELFRIKPESKMNARTVLVIVAAILTPITLIGSLIGYVRSYVKFLQSKGEVPRFHALPAIMVFAMVAGGVLIWFALWAVFQLLVHILGPGILQSPYLFAFLGINLLLSVPVFVVFRRWRISVTELVLKSNMHASATIAGNEVMQQYKGNTGFYIGGGMTYSDKGHLILMGGARSGKGKNILIPNLMGMGGYTGSWVITDIKGELAAITANHMRKTGKKVVLLNPWNILPDNIQGNSTYNPLDFLSDKSSPHLIDDVSLIAELICPSKADGDRNEFFVSSARNIISAILLHIAVTQEGKARSLATLWEWCRKSGQEWDSMLADMATSTDPVNGAALQAAANEIAAMMASAETFASIMTNCYEATNFLKSSALQDNLVSGLNPFSITDGDTAVFIIIPPDKIASHGRWLRLVVTTLMRAVVRKPNKATRTAFLCDEAAALGFVSEFSICLSSYAGYGISFFPVFQDANQMNALYGNSWQTAIANTSVKIVTGVRDNYTADYFSDFAGESTNVIYSHDWMGNVSDIETNARKLFTPEEIRRESDKNMFVFIEEHPVCVVPKLAYYEMPELKNPDGSNMYDSNPYIENSL
ncbi:type IV secretory system conjugative DNA transfer family protein [Taibaiella koreensis]|uniref:type IV secretory system conjugative DNA transfer family protein n=1 Tax=Taibaiella koreensis TaxID=1268548 RepID=UPI000E59B500|nr:type IV secretory system conjugative DNA transfer family protein [Taibaiella koreensis]